MNTFIDRFLVLIHLTDHLSGQEDEAHSTGHDQLPSSQTSSIPLCPLCPVQIWIRRPLDIHTEGVLTEI